MPYLKIVTNQALPPGGAQALAAKASAVAGGLLGKPELWVMAQVVDGAALVFGGTDMPAAFVELKSIGLPAAECARLSRALCAFLTEEAGIPSDRVYIEFANLERTTFGWNGETF